MSKSPLPSGQHSSVYIHPKAIVDEKAVIGEGTKIWALAQVLNDVHIGKNSSVSGGCFLENGVLVGDNVTIKNGCLIWSGVQIADDVFIGPSVLFTNDKAPRSPRMTLAKDRYSDCDNWLQSTLVGQGASIGAGSILLSNITIGPYAMVGAGSLVTRSVPGQALVYGSPARVRGWVCKCGSTLSDCFVCPSCKCEFLHLAEEEKKIGGPV